MTIQYNPLLTDAQYKDYRYYILLWFEENGKAELTPYTDNPNGGYATIGAGFKIDSNWDEILDAFGFDTRTEASATEKSYISQLKALVENNKFTTSQIDTLFSQLNAIMAKRADDTRVVDMNGETKRREFKFKNNDNYAEVKATFQAIAKNNDDTLSKWLGEDPKTTQYSIVPMSYERIALLSRTYNGLIGYTWNKKQKKFIPKSEGLQKALRDGNRAEAWYQMRYTGYTSQGKVMLGLVKRRFAESEFFGLYNNVDNITLDDAKQVFRMLQAHRTDIANKEALFGFSFDGKRGTWLDRNGRTPLEAAKQDYKTIAETYLKDGTIDTLEKNLDKAKTALLTDLRSRYSNLATTTNRLNDDMVESPNIFLNPHKPTDTNRTSRLDARLYESNSFKNDVMIGLDQRDEMFGGKGDDDLLGEAGNDALYGGEGRDWLEGGQGHDWLEGEGEKDWLYGGDGNDVLKGGADNDVIYGGEGNDNITGGKGDDVLLGGKGDDTYIYNIGDGTDTIEDKEGENKVIINGASYTNIIKLLVKQADGSYKTPDGRIKGVKENTDMVLYDAATGEKLAILNKDFQDGDFGIRLLDIPNNPVTTRTIVGDFAPYRDRYDYDDLGNLITDPNRPKPGWGDNLYDSTGNDRIMSYGGVRCA